MKFKPHHVLKMRPRAEKPTHRLFIALGTTTPDELIERELIQYGEGNKYSEEYAALVNEYYPEGSH
jgi:tRNA1(Val) A37 N6-methylase TrmN6